MRETMNALGKAENEEEVPVYHNQDQRPVIVPLNCDPAAAE
jgi:hypothetical protein